MIKRKQIQQDIAHGGLNNASFNDKGIPYYHDRGDINHCDKFVTANDYVYDDYTKTETVTNVHVTCNETIDNDLCVKRDTTIDRCLCVKDEATIKGATCIDDTLNVSCAICGCSTLDIDGNTTLHCNVQIDCNTCMCGTLDVDGVTNINNNVNIKGTTTITGDLHVKGTAYEEHSTDIYVGADFIGLRDGQNTALATGERSGIIINKYDAVDSLGIVADESGVLRIGEFNTVKVYTTDDVTYYSDRELTTPTTVPAGKTLYQIGETDPTTGLKEYYYIAKDETEPVTTHAATMDDHQLTCWQSDGCDIHTIGHMPTTEGAIMYWDATAHEYKWLENPTVNGKFLYFGRTAADSSLQLRYNTEVPTGDQQLQYWDVTSCNWKYLPIGTQDQVLTVNSTGKLEWKQFSGSFVFDTMADYTSYVTNPANPPIQNGSRVAILCENNYVYREDISN
jgi:hypothetical protein